MSKVWDISEPIDESSAVFPGDTPFSREWVMRMSDGMSCNVSTVRMTAHLGTHADAPFHYHDEGVGISDVDLAVYMGPCSVVSVDWMPGEAPETRVVDPDTLRRAGVDEGNHVERLLLHTIPDRKHDRTRFDPSFVALGTEAAELCVAVGACLIGIDTPSMDPASAVELRAHDVLRRAEVALLENLDLTDVPDGRYELIALPLRIVGGDGSPVRAVLRELT